jgi:hypothetical protein
LGALHSVTGAEEAAVDARCVQAVEAELAAAVREGERHHDVLAGLHRVDVRADIIHHADRLVAHAPSAVGGLHPVVRPQVAAADAGAGDADDGVGWLDAPRVGDVLDPDVPGAVHDGGAHQAAPASTSSSASELERSR